MDVVASEDGSGDVCAVHVAGAEPSYAGAFVPVRFKELVGELGAVERLLCQGSYGVSYLWRLHVRSPGDCTLSFGCTVLDCTRT